MKQLEIKLLVMANQKALGMPVPKVIFFFTPPKKKSTLMKCFCKVLKFTWDFIEGMTCRDWHDL